MLVFSLLVIVHCCAVAAIAGWVSKRLPVGVEGRRTLWYLLLIPAVPMFPVLIFLLVSSLVVALVGESAPLRRVAVADRTWLGVRALLGVAASVGVVLYATAAIDIIGRGPG